MCAMAGACRAQGVVCRDGNGSFDDTLATTGVSVHVGAARREGLATRACEGALQWEKQRVVVETNAAQVDVDAFGIDLGVGRLAVTFQVKKADADCCMKFQIYSLAKPPKLLRTLTGGSSFSTADTDLDGQVEIWTNDAAAVESFENPVGTAAIAPTVILRFVRGRLLDVSSEFPKYFDDQIARLRGGLSAEELKNFKESNGRLAPTVYFSREEMDRNQELVRTKTKVLQMVWGYLYSGREAEAWKALAEMWPPADAERIRAAIVSARDHGIRAQVDGVSAKTTAAAGNGAEVFDARHMRPVEPGVRFGGRTLEEKSAGITLPEPILIERAAPEGPDVAADTEWLVDLLIDGAGKVRSAESTNPLFEQYIKGSTGRWKFVPAMRSGRPIASHVYFVVTAKQ